MTVVLGLFGPLLYSFLPFSLPQIGNRVMPALVPALGLKGREESVRQDYLKEEEKAWCLG